MSGKNGWTRPKRVLVIYKKSAYQRMVRERKNARVQALLEQMEENGAWPTEAV